MLEITYKQEQSTTLKLVAQLCQTLENAGINYCHWKSNNALDRSANGKNDLDLLIGREDIQKFTEILFHLGFKQAKAPIYEQIPSVIDYYGYDADADKLVHVHAHYQLIIGHDRTKNYRLPIEKQFLASTIQGELFRTPTVEFEFIVFVIRMMLKYSTWDAILLRQADLPKSARNELAYLQERVDWIQIYAILSQYLPYIDAELFSTCVQSLQTDYPVWERIQLGHKVQKQLRASARCIHILDVYLKISRTIAKAIKRRIVKNLPKKRFVNGGMMIAIVGGDGAGKSTAIDELYSWLSTKFDTTKIHLGRPPKSLTTKIVRGVLKVSRIFNNSFFKYQSPGQANTDNDLAVFPGYSPLLQHLCTARDRYRTYVKARRFATNGGIVICDRFPLPQIKLMDSPQLERMLDASHKQNSFIKFLVARENSIYQQMSLPEILIILRVNPEIAVQRKTDEEPNSVRMRSTEIWQLDWQKEQTNITPHIIDASRSKKEVIAELKSLIWSVI